MNDSTLTYVGEVTSYHYIGDSHASVIGPLEFESADGKRIVTRVSGIWRFAATDMIESDEMISEPVMQALRRIAAFRSSPSFPALPGLRPVLTTYGAQKQREHLALSAHANDVPYVFTVGEINSRYILQRLVAEGIDFAVPFSTDGIDRLSSFTARHVLSAAQMLQLLSDEFTRLFHGLRILRDAGLRTLFLHCVPPPEPDDAASEHGLKISSPGRLRYKLAMFINYLYEAVCRQIGVGFINTWPLITIDNVLNPDYFLDGVHLNRKHAVLSVREVHRQFTGAPSALDAQGVAS